MADIDGIEIPDNVFEAELINEFKKRHGEMPQLTRQQAIEFGDFLESQVKTLMLIYLSANAAGMAGDAQQTIELAEQFKDAISNLDEEQSKALLCASVQMLVASEVHRTRSEVCLLEAAYGNLQEQLDQ